LLDPIADTPHLVEDLVGVLHAQVGLNYAAYGAEHLVDCPVHVIDRDSLPDICKSIISRSALSFASFAAKNSESDASGQQTR
jgi:hypothetical protein